MPLTVAILALTLTLSAHAQFRSTLCQATEEQFDERNRVRRLVGCGEGFPDNLLWHLDRADSVSGALDGRTFFPATGRGVVVYIVDTGIRREHVEFQRPTGSTVIGGANLGGFPTGGCTDPLFTPCSAFTSHGSSVASVAGGKTIGVAPDAYLVAMLSAPGTYDRLFRAIVEHAYQPTTPAFRTAIVNISAANRFEPFQIEQMEREIRLLVSGVDANFNPDPNGKRFFFSVIGGNGNADPRLSQCAEDGTVVGYPGVLGPSIDGMVTAGAITRDNTVWQYTCDGPALEVLAPGADIFLASALANDVYVGSTGFPSGTSFAAPYVAGMAARMLERDPNLTPAELEARLKASPSRVDGLPVPVMTPSPKRRAVRK